MDKDEFKDFKIKRDFVQKAFVRAGKDVSDRCYFMKMNDGKLALVCAPESATEAELEELKELGFKKIKLGTEQ